MRKLSSVQKMNVVNLETPHVHYALKLQAVAPMAVVQPAITSVLRADPE